LTEAQQYYQGVMCGGLRQDTLVYENQTEVQDEAWNALQQTSGKRFILATGCVVPIIAPHGNIVATRNIVESWTA
jgi:uroporphyrinogen decarboxylase